MRFRNLMAGISSAWIAGACATQAAQEAAQPQPARQAQGADAVQNSGAGASCSSLASGLFTRLKLNQGAADLSICDMQQQEAASAKSVLVYITSPTCVTCKDSLREIESQVRRTSGVSLTVAVPTRLDQYIETYSMADISAFAQPLAPSAKLATDPNGNVWLGLSTNRSMPTFPVALLMDRNGGYRIYQTASLDKLPVLRSGLLTDLQRIAGN